MKILTEFINWILMEFRHENSEKYFMMNDKNCAPGWHPHGKSLYWATLNSDVFYSMCHHDFTSDRREEKKNVWIKYSNEKEKSFSSIDLWSLRYRKRRALKFLKGLWVSLWGEKFPWSSRVACEKAREVHSSEGWQTKHLLSFRPLLRPKQSLSSINLISRRYNKKNELNISSSHYCDLGTV